MHAEERRELVQEAEQCHHWIKQSQALFFSTRQVVARQRQFLLTFDELAMCTARLTLVGAQPPTESGREQLCLHPAEVRAMPALPAVGSKCCESKSTLLGAACSPVQLLV